MEEARAKRFGKSQKPHPENRRDAAPRIVLAACVFATRPDRPKVRLGALVPVKTGIRIEESWPQFVTVSMVGGTICS